jgi:hypothetical protein
MLGAIVADDPLTPGLDFGDRSVVKMYDGHTVVPTFSDIIFRLVQTFFKATVTSNWQRYLPDQSVTWDPSYPVAPILTYKQDGTPTLLPTLDGFFQSYFHEPTVLPPGNVKPATPGVGEVWIDTQFEETAGKTKPGTATAVDVATWQVSKKAALPSINMNNPHNMWTDRNQNLIYVTQWFDHRLTVYNRTTGALVRNISVGEAPAHVMTRTDTDQVHVTNNGDLRPDAVMELAPLATGVERRIDIGRGNPHAHWMSHDGQKMVTPNILTGDSTQYNFAAGSIDAIVPTSSPFGHPIATGMMPDARKYYVANLLDSSIAVIDMNTHAVIKTLNLIANYNPVTGAIAGPVGALPEA